MSPGKLPANKPHPRHRSSPESIGRLIRILESYVVKAMNVFISYSQADKKWAEALRSGLTEAGFSVSDPAGDICAGENLHLEIGKALAKADAMIVLLSPDSAASSSVRAEIDFALVSPQFRDRLIPVLVKPTADIPWILRRQQFIRATKDTRETVRRVADALHASHATAA